MNDTPTATIRIGSAEARRKYDVAKVFVTIDAAHRGAPTWQLCSLPLGTRVVADIPGGHRLCSPDGVVFDLAVVGMER